MMKHFMQCESRQLEQTIQLIRAYNLTKSVICSQIHPLYVRLGESQRRIEALEQDLKKSRNAHAQEREAREQLELEKETMQERLVRMSEGLRVLATHINQPNEFTQHTSSYKNEKVANFSKIYTLCDFFKKILVMDFWSN